MSLVPVTTYIDEFESLQVRMDAFTHKFENILISKRASVLNSKQNHYVRLHDLEKELARITNDITSIQLKITHSKSLVDASLRDLQTQQRILDDLAAKTTELTSMKTTLEEEITLMSSQISELSRSIDHLKQEISHQIARDYPELLKYELYLGLRIEVVDRDVLRFVFNNVDQNDLNKEVWGQVSVGTDSLVVNDSSPKLEEGATEALLKGYDENKELIVFLKGLRALLKEAT